MLTVFARPVLASDYDGESVVIKAWADDIGAPIGEEDAARVIGTSLHGKYDIGLPGSGARSTQRETVSVSLSMKLADQLTKLVLPASASCTRHLLCCSNAISRRLCSCAAQDLDRTKFLIIVSVYAAVSTPSRRW